MRNITIDAFDRKDSKINRFRQTSENATKFLINRFKVRNIWSNFALAKNKEMKETRSAIELTRRYLAFVISLFIIALGVSLSIRANLGSSPISCPPYVLSMIPGTPLTMGGFTICMHVFFILSQIVLLRKDYQKIQLLQLVVGFLYGFYTDLTMWMTASLQWDNTFDGYIIRWIQLAIGGAMLAYGIACEVKCDVLMLAGEGFPAAIAKFLRTDFGKVKLYSDTGLVTVGVIFCFIFFGRWRWDMIGIGTLFSMIYVGTMVRFFSPHVEWLNIMLTDKEKRMKQSATIEAKEHTIQTYPLVITIARQFGSGGHEIGEKLAKALNIALYDHNIIDETAKELGYTTTFVEKNEQRITKSKLFELILTDKSIPESMNPSMDDSIFVTESRIIRKLGEKSCVIVGRCADYILRDNPNCLKIFIRSDINFAKERVKAYLNKNNNDNTQQEDISGISNIPNKNSIPDVHNISDTNNSNNSHDASHVVESNIAETNMTETNMTESNISACNITTRNITASNIKGTNIKGTNHIPLISKNKNEANTASNSDMAIETIIKKTNEERAYHYWNYTDNKWEDANNYDLLINSSKTGIDNAVTLILNYINHK